MKIFRNGQRDRRAERDYEGKFTSFKRKVKSFFRKVFIGGGIVIVAIVLMEVGGILNPQLQYQTVEAIKEVDTVPPVLERIMKCESGGKHFDKNGQVLMRSNNNKTVDVGVAQINTVWFAKASELGYDLTTEQGNRAMALWIIKNKGTSPWSATYNCWK